MLTSWLLLLNPLVILFCQLLCHCFRFAYQRSSSRHISRELEKRRRQRRGRRLVKYEFYDILTCEDIISSHVKISMISLISFVSYGNLRRSSDIFGNFRKFSENVRERSSSFGNNFGKSLEIFGKSSKTPSSVCLYNKKNITRWLEDMNVMFSWQQSRQSNIKFISSRHRLISSTNIF